jgi:sterol desaturase/sphingolipid hydroxylase (fatty acid hydroxylase superfamily)
MLGIPLGLLTANAVEWTMHRYVLHGLGKKRDTFWAFHFHEHHREVRQHGYYDPNYEKFPLGLHAQGKEAWALIASAVAITPLFPVAPFFVGTLWYSSLNYYRVHKKSHMNPGWGEQRVPWHYDHHMGNNPGANWCVTRPWFDYIMGTRVFTEGGVRETNVLGLGKIPAWLERALPKPEALGKLASKTAPRRAA